MLFLNLTLTIPFIRAVAAISPFFISQKVCFELEKTSTCAKIGKEKGSMNIYHCLISVVPKDYSLVNSILATASAYLTIMLCKVLRE